MFPADKSDPSFSVQAHTMTAHIVGVPVSSFVGQRPVLGLDIASTSCEDI